MTGRLFAQLRRDCVRVVYETGKDAQCELYGGRTRPSIPLTADDMQTIYSDLREWLDENNVVMESSPLERKQGALFARRKAKAFYGTITITTMTPTGAADLLGSEHMRIEISGKLLIDALRSGSEKA